MALFKFTKAILAGEPIPVFNHGKHTRDFTYIDDIVEGVIRTLDNTATPDSAHDPANPNPGTSNAPWRIYNIGGGQPVDLLRFIKLIEENLGLEAKLEHLPMQPGDVPDTSADVEALHRAVDYQPSTPVEVGIHRFIEWYRSYYDC